MNRLHPLVERIDVPCIRRVGTRTTFIVLAVAVSVFALLQSLVTPVLSEIAHQLNSDVESVT